MTFLLITLPIVAFIIGWVIGAKIEKSLKEDEIDPLKRRGIYPDSLSLTGSYGKEEFDIEYEVIELEKTSTKSKIKVISYTSDKSKFNMKGEYKDRVIEMVQGKWIESSKIEWIENLDKLKRKDKLDKLLK